MLKELANHVMTLQNAVVASDEGLTLTLTLYCVGCRHEKSGKRACLPNSGKQATLVRRVVKLFCLIITVYVVVCSW